MARSAVALWWVVLRLGWVHVSAHPGRALLTVLGVGLGVAATVAVQTANVDVLRSFEEAVLSVSGPATVEVSAGARGFDERLIASVRNVPGVEAARPLLDVTVQALDAGGRPRSFVILGLDLLDEGQAAAGRLPPAFDTDRSSEQSDQEDGPAALWTPNGILMGGRLASALAVSPTQSLLVEAGGRQVPLRVTGVAERHAPTSSAWDQMAVMDIAAAQYTFGLIGRLHRIDIVTEPGVAVEPVMEALRRMLPPSVTVGRPIQRSRQVESMVQAFQLNVTALSMVGLLVGMFLIYNTVSFMVAQRRREIGILRAVGMSPPMITGLFLAEAGLFGMVGGLVGSGFGLMLGRVMVGLVGRTIHELYAPMQAASSGVALSAGSLRLCIEAMLIGTAVSMLGAVGPSLDAGRTVVVAALASGAYDVEQRVRARMLALVGAVLLGISVICLSAGPVGGKPLWGYVATFCMLAGLSCLVPFVMQQVFRTHELGGSVAVPSLGGAVRRIAREQTVRGLGRNAVTVSAFLVGVAIMVGVLVMIRSFRDTVELWIDQTIMADLIVAPAGWPHSGSRGISAGLPADWRGKAAALEAVAAVDTYHEVRTDVQGRVVSLVSRDLALHAQRSRYLFLDGDSTTILTRAAAEEGVLLSEVLAHALMVTRGDRLTLMTPDGERPVVVLGLFFDYATDGGKIVMDRALYQRWWHDETVTLFPVYLRPGADLAQARRALFSLLVQDQADRLPPTILSNGELRQEILHIFDRTFTLTYVLEAIAVTIAMLGIINTLITSVVERRRELATLQAIGAGRRQMIGLIVWEAGYLGILGTAMGVVGGAALAWILIRVINRQSFGWTIHMTWPIGLLAVTAGLALMTALLAGVWPARWAAKQPLVEGLRYE